MSKDNLDTPGGRMRYVRCNILDLTQRELAAELGVTRSLIPAMEGGKQGVSKATAQKMNELWSIDIQWLLFGHGEAVSVGVGPPTQAMEPSGMSQNMRADAWRLFLDSGCLVDGKCGGYGYAGLSGTKLRIHAGRDEAIAGSRLFGIVENDTWWTAAGELTGWEFEVMRAYFDYYNDRSFAEWMECLRFIRWLRVVIQAAPATVEQRNRRTA